MTEDHLFVYFGQAETGEWGLYVATGAEWFCEWEQMERNQRRAGETIATVSLFTDPVPEFPCCGAADRRQLKAIRIQLPSGSLWAAAAGWWPVSYTKYSLCYTKYNLLHASVTLAIATSLSCKPTTAGSRSLFPFTVLMPLYVWRQAWRATHFFVFVFCLPSCV